MSIEIMNVMLASIGAIVFYFVAIILQWMRVRGEKGLRQMALGVTSLGVVCQSWAIFFLMNALHGINLDIFNIASLTALMVIVSVLASSLHKPAENLLLVVLPPASLILLLAWLMPVDKKNMDVSPMMVLHILVSVLAYGLLIAAACQSLLLSYQERLLKQHAQKPMLKALPPLQVMETLLFELLFVGVMLLSVSLLTGFLFIDDMFAKRMLHKTTLSMIAWAVFGTLLVGRWRLGWRGQRAVRWTMVGFITLLIAYFGWRIVVDFVLL